MWTANSRRHRPYGGKAGVAPHRAIAEKHSEDKYEEMLAGATVQSKGMLADGQNNRTIPIYTTQSARWQTWPTWEVPQIFCFLEPLHEGSDGFGSIFGGPDFGKLPFLASSDILLAQNYAQLHKNNSSPNLCL